MKVFEINSVPYGSTGRIMFQIADTVNLMGGEAYTSASFTKPRGECFPSTFYRIGGIVGKAAHIMLAKLTGRHGCYSHLATYKLIQKIKRISPDIIHLHNIHGWYLNWKELFNFFKKSEIPVVWTLHDCWSFTGHCPHFTAVECNKWKSGCYECPLYKSYPSCFLDDSKKQYSLKKSYFTNVPNLTIVTPSCWLADLVRQSYLKDYHTVVINNGIDLAKFKPRTSNFREKYSLVGKIILLGVAFDWGFRKGIDDFKRLAIELPEEYAIVMVGVSDSAAKSLPSNIITISCTQNQEELAEIYSASDIFVNPTLEDNFPTVNLEALACGTPVLTYQTGGSPESVDESCGWVIPYGDYESLKRVIYSCGRKTEKMIQNCVDRGSRYKREDKYMEYIKLFNNLAGEKNNEI